MSKYGRKFKIELTGTSHGPEVCVAIKGIPVGFEINRFQLNEFLKRRSAIDNDLATARKEPDEIIWKSGVMDVGYGPIKVTDKTVVATVKNTDVQSGDYEQFKTVPRPGHADYAAIMKDGADVEIEGGGRFSGRLTVGLCIAGGIAEQILAQKGISFNTEIKEIGGCVNQADFEEVIYEAREAEDSVGGIIECTVTGLEPGSCGDSYFDGLEGRISEACFGVPAVKGVEFGAGFKLARMMGSESNDAFAFDYDGAVITLTNNHGGILGGIASGMPIVVRVAIKPTPSIGKVQESVNLNTGESEELRIYGRHDPCIVPRAAVCIEAAVAIAILDSYVDAREYKSKFDEARAIIDEQNDIILEAFNKRMDAAKTIGEIKASKGLPIYDADRETAILNAVSKGAKPEYREYTTELFEKLLELSRNLQEGGFYGGAAIDDLASDYEEQGTVEERPLRAGLLGRTLGHSFSPRIHEMIADRTELNYTYELFEVEPDELASFMEEQDFDALNVTIPYKQEVIQYLDELTPEAQAIGAVNTIVKRNGKLIGDNTDYDGLVYTFKKYGAKVAGAKCLILGEGGGSKAARAALLMLGAKEARTLSHKEIDEGKALVFHDADILVNATPVGMYPMDDESIVDLNSFIKLSFVMDLIYNPAHTKLVMDAKMHGIKVATGLDMLVAQAVKSVDRFFDIELEDEIVDEIKHELILDEQNIVIIGMPGSGKTTIGQALANVLGKEFYDTDEMIEYRLGKSPKEIINTEGEQMFREYEKDVCSVLSNVKNAVIATGGGIVKKNENYYNLAKYSHVVFIEKGMDSLAVTDRPISELLGLEKIYLDRLPKYEKWANTRVNIDGLSLEQAVEKILESM